MWTGAGKRSHSGVTGKVLQSWHHFKWLYLSWFCFIQIYLIGLSQPWQDLKERMTIKSRILLSPNCRALDYWLTDEPWGLPFLQLVSAFYLDFCFLGQWWHWKQKNDPLSWELRWRRNWQSWFNSYWKSIKKRLTECFVCSINIYQVTNMYSE